MTWLEKVLQEYYIEMKNPPDLPMVITKEIALKSVKDITKKYAKQIEETYKNTDKSKLHELVEKL